MEIDSIDLASRIRDLRLAMGAKQTDLENKAGLPFGAICKIEKGKREASALELYKIAQALGISMDCLVSDKEMYVVDKEVKVLEALREIPYEDYKRILGTLEFQVYFTAKQARPPLKKHLMNLVTELSLLAESDGRPKSKFENRKRVKN